MDPFFPKSSASRADAAAAAGSSSQGQGQGLLGKQRQRPLSVGRRAPTPLVENHQHLLLQATPITATRIAEQHVVTMATHQQQHGTLGQPPNAPAAQPHAAAAVHNQQQQQDKNQQVIIARLQAQVKALQAQLNHFKQQQQQPTTTTTTHEQQQPPQQENQEVYHHATMHRIDEPLAVRHARISSVFEYTTTQHAPKHKTTQESSTTNNDHAPPPHRPQQQQDQDPMHQQEQNSQPRKQHIPPKGFYTHENSGDSSFADLTSTTEESSAEDEEPPQEDEPSSSPEEPSSSNDEEEQQDILSLKPSASKQRGKRTTEHQTLLQQQQRQEADDPTNAAVSPQQDNVVNVEAAAAEEKHIAAAAAVVAAFPHNKPRPGDEARCQALEMQIKQLNANLEEANARLAELPGKANRNKRKRCNERKRDTTIRIDAAKRELESLRATMCRGQDSAESLGATVTSAAADSMSETNDKDQADEKTKSKNSSDAVGINNQESKDVGGSHKDSSSAKRNQGRGRRRLRAQRKQSSEDGEKVGMNSSDEEADDSDDVPQRRRKGPANLCHARRPKTPPPLKQKRANKQSSGAEEASSSDEADNEEEESESEGYSGSESDEWEDSFPFEENLFALGGDYHFVRRIATNSDAVVYHALSRLDGTAVAIKICDTLPADRHPKNVRILAAVQGSPVLSRMVCWHMLPNTECYALVTQLARDDRIDKCIFGRPLKVRQYVHDLFEALAFMKSRNVLYRDTKPSNILWNDLRGRAIVIDFDCATFYAAGVEHRRHVGTHGYMAPEMASISEQAKAARKRYRELRKAMRIEMQRNLFTPEQRSLLVDVANGSVPRSALDTMLASMKKYWGSRTRIKIDKLLQYESAVAMHDKKGYVQSLNMPGLPGYGFAADVWSAGVVLAQMLIGVIEEDVTDDDMPEMSGEAFLKRLKLLLDARRYEAKRKPTGNWLESVFGRGPAGEQLCDDFVELDHVPTTALELATKMLEKNPSRRITIEDALAHPYFTTTLEETYIEAGKRWVEAHKSEWMSSSAEESSGEEEEKDGNSNGEGGDSHDDERSEHECSDGSDTAKAVEH